MNGRSECKILREILDVFDDPAGAEPRRELERHAADCPECAALLRVRHLLAAPSREALEGAAPDVHVRGMWRAVRDAMPGAPASGGRPALAPPGSRLRAGGRFRRPPVRPLVAGLAAAGVALALLAGGLAVERTRLLERQVALAERLADRERRLAALEGAGRAPAALSFVGTPPWERILAAERTVTLGRLRDLLATLPPGTTLLDASEVRALATAPPVLASELAPVLAPAWPRARPHLDLADGLQAGELRAALEALDLADHEPVPTAKLLEVYRDARRAARS